MVQASVGFHCPECTAAGGSRAVRERAWSVSGAGAAPSGGTRYPATRVILALNLLAFAYSVVRSGSFSSIDDGLLADGGLIARARLLAIRGGVESAEMIGVDVGEYYRLLTSAFLHADLVHLLFNLYALWLLGHLLEIGLGSARFLALYAVSAAGGAFGVLAHAPNVFTVGASGAVFGLLGAIVLTQRIVGGRLWRSPFGVMLIINVVLTLLIPQVSVGGHLGGLAAGAAIGAMALRLEARGASKWYTVAIGAAAVLVLGVGCVWAASSWHDPLIG